MTLNVACQMAKWAEHLRLLSYTLFPCTTISGVHRERKKEIQRAASSKGNNATGVNSKGRRRMVRLVPADRKATVTQITLIYNYAYLKHVKPRVRWVTVLVLKVGSLREFQGVPR